MMKLFSIYDKIKKAKFLVKVAEYVNDKLPKKQEPVDEEIISTIKETKIEEK